MIISHSKKFIFIHIYKVAGSSFRHTLGHYAILKSRKNILRGIINKKYRISGSDFSGHITAAELKSLIPDNIFENYFKFAFVRNPWDWQVSLYHFARQKSTHWQHQHIGKMTFEEYIDWRVEKDLHTQKEFVCDDKGEIIVDFIGKLENLQDDYRKICNMINVPYSELPKKNSSIHDDYRSYYNSKTIDIVAKAFEDDILTFNYSFE